MFNSLDNSSLNINVLDEVIFLQFYSIDSG